MAKQRKAAAPKVPGNEDALSPRAPVDPAAAAQEQGTDVAPKKDGTTELNNIAGRTANDVGADREAVVRSMAVADAARHGRTPDLAPPADIGRPVEPTSTKRKAIMNGVEVDVDVPTVRKNSAVAVFGPEVSYPKGTPIRADGKPCEGNDEAVGVVGDVNTPQGKLVNRVIKFDTLKSAV